MILLDLLMVIGLVRLKRLTACCSAGLLRTGSGTLKQTYYALV